LKTFGSLCFTSTLDGNRTKLGPRARKCVFLRFKTRIKGYVVLDTNNREIFINRNVIFYENIFPYKIIHTQNLNNEEQTKNIVQGDFGFFKEYFNHNLDNNNLEIEIDINVS